MNDIALATVADDYIAALRGRSAEFPIAEASLFLVIAADLMLIKSRSLLPHLTLSDAEETDIESLEERLRQYERYRQLARQLQSLFGAQPLAFREAALTPMTVFAPGNLTVLQLSSALEGVIANLPKKQFVKTAAVAPVVSIEEMMQQLAERVRQSMRLRWSDIVGGNGAGKGEKLSRQSRIEAIVAFLALLELVKRGAVAVMQRAHFEDIHIENAEVGVPVYG